jgi:hypothetical protein
MSKNQRMALQNRLLLVNGRLSAVTIALVNATKLSQSSLITSLTAKQTSLNSVKSAIVAALAGLNASLSTSFIE